MLDQERMMDAIVNAGYGGVRIWKNGDEWLGCLLDKELNVVPNSTCWHYQPSVNDVISDLYQTSVRKGE